MSDQRTPKDASTDVIDVPAEAEVPGVGGTTGPAVDGGDMDGVVHARTQWQLFRRKFLRHKAAMASLVVLTIIVLASVFADQVAPYGFNDIDVVNRDQGPTLEANHFFGTDRLGRDYFSRVLYGTRNSLIVAALVTTVSTAVGTTVGALAGYFGGWVDAFLMRFTDLVLVLPALAVLLVAAGLLSVGDPISVGLIVAALLWVSLARIVRGTFLSLREKEYVEAAKAGGASDIRIIVRHILPNALGPIIVNATLLIATAILIEATLAFLGFGTQPPTPALGLLIDDGRSAMQSSWWLVVMPGLMIIAICLCVNFIGDGLRDALDPTQQESA